MAKKFPPKHIQPAAIVSGSKRNHILQHSIIFFWHDIAVKPWNANDFFFVTKLPILTLSMVCEFRLTKCFCARPIAHKIFSLAKFLLWFFSILIPLYFIKLFCFFDFGFFKCSTNSMISFISFSSLTKNETERDCKAIFFYVQTQETP